jgi:hypothetical protein
MTTWKFMPNVATRPTGRHGQQDDRRVTHECEALAQVLHDRSGRPWSRHQPGQVELVVTHQRQADDHGEETHGVDRECRSDPERADRQTRDGGADDAGAVEHRRVDRHGVADVPRPDHLDRECLANGHIDGIRTTEQHREHEDHPDLDDGGRGQDREDHRQDHHRGLDRDQGLPLGQDVGEDPGEQAEDHDRQELGARNHTQPERVAGQGQDQPPLRDLLHPGADEGDRLAAEEQAVIAMPEWAAAFAHATRLDRGTVRPVIARVPGARDGDRARPRARQGARRGAVAIARRVDHLGEALCLGFEGLDLALDAGPRVIDECSPFGRVVRGAEPLPIAFAGGLVLQQLTDLRQREARLVAQLLDRAEALEIGRVVQAVRPLGPGSRLEQPDLFVVADRAGCQTGLGGHFLDLEQRSRGGRSGRGRGCGHRPVTIPQR